MIITKQADSYCGGYEEPSLLNDGEIRGKISCLEGEIDQLEKEKKGYADASVPLVEKYINGIITSTEEKILEEYNRLVSGLEGIIDALNNWIESYRSALSYRQASLSSGRLISMDDKSQYLLKPPKDWTEAELKNTMKEREKVTNSSEKKQMMEREREWFSHIYGDEPISFDETGKMIQPRPVQQINKAPVPVKTKDGKLLEDAIERIEKQLPHSSDDVSSIRRLQSGLNMLNNEKNKTNLSRASRSVKLKEDGLYGSKTDFGLKKALVEEGTNKVSEAIGLGQFKETVKKAKKSGGIKNLAGELSGSIGRLLPQSKTPKIGFQPEGLALQDTLNDLGANLKDDGIVGPKTNESFNQMAKKIDPDEFSMSLGKSLGFQW